MKKFFGLIFILVLSFNSVLAETNGQIIQRLSLQLQKHNVVEATRKGYNSPSDVERRKKISELNQEIARLRKEEQNKFTNDIKAMESEHINLLNNLKTCTRSGAKVITGNQYVLGSKNGLCYYRVDVGTKGRHLLCSLPMDVAKKFAQEAINSINSGKESSYTESVLSGNYCKFNNQ